MRRKTKEENGITLIALVVTIVVLLILVGITLTYVMGDNGIVKQAQDAKVRHEISKYQEAIDLTRKEVQLNEEHFRYCNIR